MFVRIYLYFFLLILGAVLGEHYLPIHTPWLGAFCVDMILAVSWFLYDERRADKILQWIKKDPLDGPPFLTGLWGELGERIFKLNRVHQQELAKSDQRLVEFLTAIQASPHGVILIKADGKIEWSNQTASDHLGIDFLKDREQIIGNLVRDPIYQNYAASNVFDHEVVIQGHQSQINKPSRISLQLFPYGDGRKLLLTRDVTALEQAELMRRDFVANVSHEIRTPLTVLAGFVETMQNLSLSPEDQTRYLSLMQSQSSRMQTLVEDLLTLSKLEGSPMPSGAQFHSIEEMLNICEQEARGLMNTLATHSQVDTSHRLSFEIDSECIGLEVAGNRAELISAMSNLISNALRYTPSGGDVRVLSQVNEVGDWYFAVEDSGPGISAEHLPRLTERFYRVDRSRSRETGGTGLGLAIVKHVVQRHGGELSIQSVLSRGSTFAFTLPKSRLHVTQAALPSESNAQAQVS
jgi:two-component system phosphate regulon sensor histidine kinase PhoR